MPDVGLTSRSEPVSGEYKPVIRYTVEVDGLPVYTETYDAEKLKKELESDEQTVRENWFRRVKCVVGCRSRRGFSACLTRCRLDRCVCDEGHIGARP